MYTSADKWIHYEFYIAALHLNLKSTAIFCRIIIEVKFIFLFEIEDMLCLELNKFYSMCNES